MTSERAAEPAPREDGWEELRREIEARHVPTKAEWPECAGCEQDWPCDASRLAAARGEPPEGRLDVDRLEKALIRAFNKNLWSAYEGRTYVGRRRIAKAIAEEFDRLSGATPTTPEPDQ